MAHQELHGTAYLYTLAAVSVAFLGFTAIVVIIRQSVGEGLSRIQVLLVHVLIEHGFAVIGFALLPPLIALFDLSHDLVLRISSAVAALVVILWHMEFSLRRYSSAVGQRLPRYAYVNFSLTAVFSVLLCLNAYGGLFEPQAGVYAAAISWLLCQAANIFLLSFNVFLKKPKRKGVRA